MSPNRPDRARLDALFAAALELPVAERAAFCDRECPPGELRAALDQLLAHGEGTEPTWPQLAAPALLEAELDSAALATGRELLAGERLGPYEIVGELGRGGMAVVYAAQRVDGLFRQKVAIKVLGRAAGDLLAVRRFEQERRILASLEHPNIARIFDGGRTADERPYFVMEQVEGLPIDRYCDQRGLTLAARLRLFVQVGRAVEAAHRRLVVHRDIKPSNVLVGDGGEVKLLDFGIAKLLEEGDGDPAANPALTRAAIRVMTPDYASPEQLRGAPVATASDIYQLGLLLFELLVGAKPFPRFAGGGFDPAEGARRNVPRPSQALSRTAAAELDPLARARGFARVADWRRELQGDLDTLVSQALQEEPERRYASASHLVEDVERYLAGLPIAARPDSLLYRARKFAGRHRLAVVAAALFLLLLGGLSTYYAVSLKAERDAARREAEKARQVSDFLASLFRAADPYSGKEQASMSARELLDRGSARVEKDLAGQPAVQGALFFTFGNVYRSLGVLDAARGFYEKAVDRQSEAFGHDAFETLESRRQLARLDAIAGKAKEALAADQAMLVAYEKLFGPDDPRLAPVLAHLALIRGRLGGSAAEIASAEAEVRRAIRIFAAAEPPRYFDLADAHASYAVLLRRANRIPEAIDENRAAADFFRRADPQNPQVAGVLGNLAYDLSTQNRLAESRQAYNEALALLEGKLSPEHPQRNLMLLNLARLEVGSGRSGEALRLLEVALPNLEKSLGPAHSSIGVGLSYRAQALIELGRAAEALPVIAASREHYLRGFAPESAELLDLDRILASALHQLGRDAEARVLILATIDKINQHLLPGNEILPSAQRTLATIEAGRAPAP